MNKLWRRVRKAHRKAISNQSGVALLIALFAMTVMMVIAVEVTFDTAVDYSSTSQSVNRLKAYYAARAGTELSLLRIKMYRKLVQQMGSGPAAQMIPTQILDQVWQLPFMWPFPVPDNLSAAEKDQVQKLVTESQMDAQYTMRIESEGNKVDINDLASPSQALAKSTREQVLRIFSSQIEVDEKFADLYRTHDFGALVNNITDWIDEDRESQNGGDEGSAYGDIRPFMPPNQPFKSVDELHMVAGMNDDFYNLLAPRITVYGIKGVNVNYASREMLMSLDPKITDEIYEKLLKYRTDMGPFKNKDEFFAFLRGEGINTSTLDGEGAIPLYFESEFNFRITSTGTFGKSIREIVAITYDFDRVKDRLVEALKADDTTKPNPTESEKPVTPSPTGGAPAKTAAPAAVSKGRPNIVYWQED